ncbi:MAG: hypothetical protein RI891_1484, partial [Gemmatimonadota bacterium]
MGGLRDLRLRLQRLPTRRDEDHPVQGELLERAVRQEEMAEVRGIERPAKDAEALPHRGQGRG